MSKLIYKQECYEVVGACMEVHKEMGCGFLEAVYQEALSFELSDRDIPYKCEKEFTIKYKSRILHKKYIADFVCYDKIIVELKALSALTNDHRAQVINYLKASKMKLGILVNFGKSSLEYERIVLERKISENSRNSRTENEEKSANDANLREKKIGEN